MAGTTTTLSVSANAPIGQSNYSNVIAFNGGHGIAVQNTARATVRLSDIHSNGGLGINLVGGSEGDNSVTANDAGDADTGPNGLLNYPVIASATSNATIQFSLNMPAAQYQVEFFTSASCDESNHGEGEDFIMSRLINHFPSEGGTAASYTTPVGPLPAGHFVTATAVSANGSGDTSEFSACVPVTSAAPAWTGGGSVNWSAGSMPGSTTVVSDGTSAPPRFRYDFVDPNPAGGECCSDGEWTFQTTAASTGPVVLDWYWNGFHAYFQVRAKLEYFVDTAADAPVYTTLVNAGPTSCCTTPSAGFTYSGVTTINVGAGDTYGFRMSGSNGDTNGTMQGTFELAARCGQLGHDLLVRRGRRLLAGGRRGGAARPARPGSGDPRRGANRHGDTGHRARQHRARLDPARLDPARLDRSRQHPAGQHRADRRESPRHDRRGPAVRHPAARRALGGPARRHSSRRRSAEHDHAGGRAGPA